MTKNVLLMSMDDCFAYWRYRNVYGARLQTPNLDRICEQATAFQAAYCQVPVCGPSRASFMSGMAPHQTGVFDNYTSVFDVLRPEQMWSYRLKLKGYYCSTAGKVHHMFKPLPDEQHDTLYNHPSRHVFFGPKRDAAHNKYGGLMGGVGTTDEKLDRQYYDARSAQDAIRFLNGYEGDAPFYREVGFHHPHPPFRTPDRFKQMYDEEDFSQPEDWAGGMDSSAFVEEFVPENYDQSDLEHWRKSVRNYFSALTHVDSHIGRVWDALQASPHADNTVVIIMADHGYHLGDKHRFRKFSLWEEATGVPMIIFDPDNPVGREITTPVATLDVGPTVMDYTDSAPLQGCAGRSLRPMVEGAAPDAERAVPTVWFGSAAIRKGNYRYIRYQDGSEQLYDVTEDLSQLHDLSKDSPLMPEMRKALDETTRAYGLTQLDHEEAVPDPTTYLSVLRGVRGPVRAASRGAVSVGDLPDAPGAPGMRRFYVTLPENGTVHVPPGYREVSLAADVIGSLTDLRIVLNDDGNRVLFKGGHKRFHLTVEDGAGDDFIEVNLDPLTAHLTRGDNVVNTGSADAQVYCGSGHDRVESERARTEVFGATGDLTVICGDEEDVVHCGSGRNHITCGGGRNEIFAAKGQSVIVMTKEADTRITFARTGLPQRIEGFNGGSIDVTDWTVMGEPLVTKAGRDVVVSCGTEVLTVAAAKIAEVRAALMA
ncbi:MAG: hypothetical protein CSA72_10660 [Rhodobacterales bacterium]|nr:MAG: hypothetical protein CSA72_10660 [Rhodobacterales bacterium]